MDGVKEMIEHKGLCNAGGKEMAKSWMDGRSERNDRTQGIM